MKYSFEKDFLDRNEDKTDFTNHRDKATEVELKKLKEEYPKIPSEFLEYLSEIGSGSFLECQFQVQKYLFDLDDLGLTENYDLKEGIKFFGDNYAGDFSGFDFNDNPTLVVEFWHEDGTIYQTNKTFKEYIREQMLIDENGEDKRE